MIKLLENLIRSMRQIRPIWRLRFWVNGFKFYPIGGGEGEPTDPPADPPPTDPPASDPPPTDPQSENVFFDGLSEENRAVNVNNVATLSKFKSADELAKSYVNLESKIGEKGIILPKEGDPADRERYLNELGRPEAPEGYKLDTIEGLHESITVTPESQAAFQVQAHKMGFTNEQTNELNTWFLNSVS